jgi:hypothetical protein
MVSAKTVRRLRTPAAILLLSCIAMTAGCRKSTDASFVGTFRMGERVQVGPLVYQVLESDWRNELGAGGRIPRDRYLFVKVSITNSSGTAVSVPGFTIEGNGKSFGEITEEMDKVDNWFGLLRNIEGSQTEQGWVVFDAPMAAYKLVATDGGDVGAEKYAHVDIPVHLE